MPMREAADATRSQKSAIVRMFRRSTYNNRHLRVFENADIMSDVFPIRRSPTTTVFCPASIFDDNDFSVKVRHAVEFLQKGDKVRVIIAFRGRELSHPELGQQVIDRLIAVIGEQAIIDAPAKMLGKNCQMMLAPNPKMKKKADAPKAGEAESEA